MDKSLRGVGYVVSEELLAQADRISSVSGRASMVHALIEVYGLLDHMVVIPAVAATLDDLTTFHSTAYIDQISAVSALDECDDQQFGLEFDCPVMDDLTGLLLALAGGSLTAADALCQRQVHVAINWAGGWHHAQRHHASGFCYVNDVVLAVLRLQRCYPRVLYVDLDVHHGDGVQNAFYYTSSVLTVSLHHVAPGFFPCTGGINELGAGRGRNFTLNLPLDQGLHDETLEALFAPLLAQLLAAFRPDAVVLQLGCDGLAGDPLGAFNLTPAALSSCARLVVDAGLPTLLLGGGGYRPANAARCWTQVTAQLLDVSLDEDVPEHTYFHHYGPSFELSLARGTVSDANDKKQLADKVATLYQYIECLSNSVAHHTST